MTSPAPRLTSPGESTARASVRRYEPAGAPAVGPYPERNGVAHAAVADEADAFGLVVRRGRIHFDTTREYVDGPAGRIVAGWTLRFFALHDKGSHVVPACPWCRRLGLDLRRLAATALCDGSLEADVEIGSVLPALYESASLPGRDEVALSVRIWRRGVAHESRAAEDGYAAVLRRCLKRFGLAES
jgi:hypothetical protein